MQKYGVEYGLQSEVVKNKIKETNLQKYGVKYPAQNKEISRKTAISRSKSIYENGTAPCSKQQKYIFDLIGGELNYPVEYYNLDIAFPQDNIYVEYDGGGHALGVKFGQVTMEEFKQKEYRRYNYLRDNN